MAKAFKITQNNQYIQPITLNAGEYTFSAWIRADDETYKFGLRKMDNQLLEFDLSDQLVLQQWAKVRLTFHLTERVKEFSLMSSGAGNGKTYHVVNPMFEEGSNAGTPKPNELDIEEQVEIGSVTMTLGVTYYVFEFDDNKSGSETIDIPVYVVRNGTYVDIPATDISISSTMPAGMTAVFEQNNIKLTVNDMASKNGQLQINVSVGGIGYIGYFNWRSVSNGKDGEGIAIKGTVDNYAALAQLTGLTAGDSYFNNADGMLYVWDGTAFPPEGQGILFQGKDGESSIIADLDNENQSISVDTDGTYMFGLPISTKFSIYAGATSLVLDSLAVQSISGVTATAVKETGIVTVTEVAKTVPDKIDLKITGKATVNSIQYTREAYLTINKIKRGEEGDSPILYELQPSVKQIKKLANGTLVPSTISCRMIVTSASGSNSTTTLPYFLSAERSLDNGATWSGYSLGTSINTESINTSVRFRLYQETAPITMLDIETIMIVEDGKYGDDGKSPEIRNGYWWVYENGQWSNTGIKAEGKDGESNIISDLDNENQSIAVTEDGSYLYGLPITSKFTIYSGDTEVALDSLSVQSIAGVSSSANKSTGVVTVSSIAKSVSDKIDIKITGKATVKGVQYTRESYLTINKVRKGEKGDSPILYELQPSVSQIKKLSNGTFTPESISCRLLVTDANGSYATTTKPSSLSVEYSLDNGVTWSSYSLGTSINTSTISNSIQFRLYQDTSPITMLDIETIMVVEDGADGKDGYTPIKGTDYFDGKNGQDGTSEHLHIRYSMSPDGSNFDIDPSNKLYIGITTSTTGVAPTLKTKYNWTLIKGSDGVKGEKGTDGESRYLHIKYSDNGTSFTANMGETLGSWIGMYVDKIEKDSTRFDDYTWRKVDGEDGENAKWLKLNSTATQIKVDRNNNSLPASITVFAQLYNMSGTATWTYSVNGGNFTSTLPTGVARTGNRITVTSASVTFQVLSIKAVMGNAEDTVSISRVVDGERGVPGKSPVTKEYRVGQTYYNNDLAVHYVYYRVGNSWWKLKDSVESHTASTPSPNTVYFEQLSSVEVMVAETIIAENANLAEFIFKDKKMFSQLGTNSAGDSIKLGEYVQFQFGIYNSTTPPASNWSGWNNTPPTTTGNYLWIRYKITSESVWAVKRVTGTDPDFTVQFGALKDGTFSNPPYQAGRNWMKMSDGRLYAITEELALGDYDPNMLLDGFTGKSIMNNISLKGSIGINPKIINSGNVSNYMKWINYRGVSRYGLILNEDIGFNLTFIDVSFDEIAHIIFPTGSEAFKYIGLEANIINYTNTSSNFIRAIDVNTAGSNYTDLHKRSFLRVICVPMGATVAWVKLAEIQNYS